MARRKNVKRIDPRYFLSETTHRGLSEADQAGIEAHEKCLKKGKANSKAYEKCLDEQGIAENLDEGGCGDHDYGETQTIVIDDEEAAVTPMDTAEGLANELLSVAQRIADMLGQESAVSSLPAEEDEFMMEEKDSFSKAGEEIEKKGTEGVFTAKAKKRGMSAQEFARKVLANTDEYDLKTVRQASFAKGADTVAKKK